MKLRSKLGMNIGKKLGMKIESKLGKKLGMNLCVLAHLSIGLLRVESILG